MAILDSRALPDPEAVALVDDLYHASGVDVRGWLAPVLAQRIDRRLGAEGCASVAALRARLLDDRKALERLVLELAAPAPGPFADAAFVRALREDVVPRLRTYPSIRVWHAGCSTGDDLYATVIVLREAGLLARATFYATDMSEIILARARAGASDTPFERSARAYQEAGGRASFAEYYLVEGERCVVRPLLRERIVFGEHSFASDASINEFHLIVSRGVLSQYAPPLLRRAQQIMHDSLCRFGYLMLGAEETLALSPVAEAFEPLARGAGLHRRVR
jgi:chemotaxis protein methyltransferase CheR